MYDFVGHITRFRQELHRNPRVRLEADDFQPNPRRLELSWLAPENQYIAKDLGGPFPLPDDDQQLLALPRNLDLAWGTRENDPLAGSQVSYACGCLNMRALSTAFAEPTYRKLDHYAAQELAQTPEFRIATLFDCGSAANTTTHLTYLLYDEASRQYHGLALEYEGRLLRLPLSLGDYVRAALRWYGGWGWQFLYVSLDDFDNLVDGSTRIGVYTLCDGLPELFPQADWAIIADKQAYFDIARPHALNYRQRSRR